MPFIDATFGALAALCTLSFFSVARRFRPQVLTFWGGAFYAMYAPAAGALAAALVLLVYGVDRPRLRWIAVAVLVALLAYHKRPDGTIVPLGLSFLAFELIHYTIERHRGKIAPARMADLAAFVFFFPARAAGPIKRYAPFAASLAAAEAVPELVTSGCARILAGLFKKVALANPLALVAAPVTAAGTAVEAWTAMFAYSLQIYFDFSAYSDIAIGVSRLMGIDVPENFRWPYLSSNIQDFWNRWHISLSSWTRDYVFMPVGRSLFKTRLRGRSAPIAAASYLASFLVIGAWHGLRPNFLLWGVYHGLLVTMYHLYKAWLPLGVMTSRAYQSAVASCAGALLTFLLVTIGWVLFRLDVPEAGRVLRLMFLL